MHHSTRALTPDTTTVAGAGASAEHATVPLSRLSAIGTPTATALARAARPDYFAWLAHVTAAAGCSHPIKLSGQVHHVNPATGEITSTRPTSDMPDGAIYTPCGNRRAVVCPSCSETYRADTYQLVLAGLKGGKGVPDTVAVHPCVFPTFTAPSFGLVHSRRERNGRALRCRPRRNPELCPHGVDLACNRVHKEGERILGRALCLDCYDFDHQVIWNAFAGELWRRTSEAIKRNIGKAVRAQRPEGGKRRGPNARLSFAKVAEFQGRGVAHFHALMRLDGIDPTDPDAVIPPPAGLDFAVLDWAIREAVGRIRFRTPGHPDNPDGWLIEWGTQLDIRPVRARVDGEITDGMVAAYLAKYATKATEITGHASKRLTPDTIDAYADATTHAGRLVAACWDIGRPDACKPVEGSDAEPPYLKLRRWAHMLGFGGHFSSKSRRYSTTLRALREARTHWRRERYRRSEHVQEETTLIVGALTYAGSGWRTTGDALLANTAAAQAREHRRVAKEELQALAAA